MAPVLWLPWKSSAVVHHAKLYDVSVKPLLQVAVVTATPVHTPFDTVEPTPPSCVTTLGTELGWELLQMPERQHVQASALNMVTLLTPPVSTPDDTAMTCCPGVM